MTSLDSSGVQTQGMRVTRVSFLFFFLLGACGPLKSYDEAGVGGSGKRESPLPTTTYPLIGQNVEYVTRVGANHIAILTLSTGQFHVFVLDVRNF